MKLFAGIGALYFFYRFKGGAYQKFEKHCTRAFIHSVEGPSLEDFDAR